MSEIRKLTRLGGDVRKIAALLQSKGRGRDTILAHITPQEAALLKSRGGRGSTNPETGLLEFEDDVGAIEDYQGGGDVGVPAGGDVYEAPVEPSVAQSFPVSPGGAAPTFQPVEQPATPVPMGAGGVPGMEFGIGQPTGAGDQPSAPAPAAPDKTLMQQAAAKTGLSEDQLAKALGAGFQGITGLIQSRRAAKEGQAAKSEMQALAAPYRSQGQQMQALAQAGQLSPVGQQQLEAARAQLAQKAQARGGVGAAQVATQIEALRQQLLQAQSDYGLKLSNIGDQIALGAIRTGLQADQYVNQLQQNYFANLMRMIGGQQPQVPGAQQPGGQ